MLTGDEVHRSSTMGSTDIDDDYSDDDSSDEEDDDDTAAANKSAPGPHHSPAQSLSIVLSLL